MGTHLIQTTISKISNFLQGSKEPKVSTKQNIVMKLGVVLYIYNSNTPLAEAERQGVEGQYGIHGKMLL